MNEINDLKDDYSWQEAFTYADNCGAVVGFKGDDSGFAINDVAEVYATDDGTNDELDWVGLFRLKDGRFASLRAGCDYTGWDCQAWGNSNVADTFERMWKYGLDDYERERLKDARERHLILSLAGVE